MGESISKPDGRITMNGEPKVSIVIPLLNMGSTIGRALDSVFSQTFDDFEVIVVDGGSIDDGPSKVISYGNKVRLVDQNGKGVSDARNQGIGEAKAELVAFLDADDEWSPDHLETIIRLRKSHPEAGLYGTNYDIEHPDHSVRPSSIDEHVPKAPWEGLLSRYFLVAALGDPPFFTSTVAVPRNVLKEMNGFSIEAWWGEDTDLWGRIALKYPMAFSWKGRGIYHSDADRRATTSIRPVEENIFVVHGRAILAEGKVPSDTRDDLVEYLALKMIHTAERNLAAGRPDLARRNLAECKTRYRKRRRLKRRVETFMPVRLHNFVRKMGWF